MLEHRNFLLNDKESPVQKFLNTTIRFIWRATNVYAKIFNQMKLPKNLMSYEYYEQKIKDYFDGAGTKSSLAYLYWKETGDLSVWKGIAQDALIMNIDDLLCVGAVDNILVSSTIGRNKLLVPGEVISAIINGTDELLAELKKPGSRCLCNRR